MRPFDNSLSLKGCSGSLFARTEFKPADVDEEGVGETSDRTAGSSFRLCFVSKPSSERRSGEEIAVMSQTKRRFFSGACEGFAGSSAVRVRSLPMLQSDAEALADTLSLFISAAGSTVRFRSRGIVLRSPFTIAKLRELTS